MVSLVAHLVKLPEMQETQVLSGSGKSPGEGNGNPLQYSCLGNSMNRAAWWAIVHGVARVGHDLATKLPQSLVCVLLSLQVVYNKIISTANFYLSGIFIVICMSLSYM